MTKPTDVLKQPKYRLSVGSPIHIVFSLSPTEKKRRKRGPCFPSQQLYACVDNKEGHSVYPVFMYGR